MEASLSPMDFPIRQSRLIEASAGTGKTFTIATLYVRLVLGHGGPGEHPRPMTPPEILVVTFTEAATKELRDRIRARLAQAARHFRAAPGSTALPAGDPLADLRDAYPTDRWPACARLLELAAAWMDESAVSTIHSWCARMLREHAFDSESLFSQTMELDQNRLLDEVAADYWRCCVAGLDLPAARQVREHWWTAPRMLVPDVRPLLRLLPVLGPGEAPQALMDARLAVCDRLKAGVREHLDDFRQCLDAAVDARAVDRRKLQARYYQPWLDQLSAWAGDPDLLEPDLSESAWNRLTPQGMAQAVLETHPDHALRTHPVPGLLDEVRQLAIGLADDKRAALQHAAHWIGRQMESVKRSRALMGPDDLLTRLYAALHGPGGGRLAGTIRRQFPVAFIDEFQDTDPIQYGIFDAVYRLAEADPDTAVVLIGDPKQAIYSFRGADIHAYLDAREACGERLHTLQRNFRSTVDAVAATNWVFACAQGRDPRGAFRSTGPRSRIPFQGAEAQGRPESLWVDESAQPALTVWCLEDPESGAVVGNGVARDRQSDATAAEIVRLLNLAAAGRAGFRPADGSALRILTPADVAVLVSTATEAGAVRRALARRGVRSVYLSDRDSVYDSAQAGELEAWLSACADPEDAALVRAALATPAMGLRWSELDALRHDEHAWGVAAERFLGYRTVWREQGVLPMLRRLLHDHGIPARLLGGAMAAGQDSGERALTNLLHLAELLQRAAEALDGEHALIRYLARQRVAPDASAADDARQIRLESDAGLVQVVTVFKSKGLEYPLVFLPFADHARPVTAEDVPVKWHDEQGRLQLSLAPDARQLALADQERQAEDLRRLYVALTRARFATWMGVSAVKRLEVSGVGHLLGFTPAADATDAGPDTVPGPGGEPPPAGLAARLEWLWAPCPHIRILPVPAPDDARYQGRATQQALGPARSSVRVHAEHWWIGSYTALARQQAPDGSLPDTSGAADTARHEHFAEIAAGEAVLRPPPGAAPPLPGTGAVSGKAAGSDTSATATIHNFPAGAQAGSFLHEVLEWAAQRGMREVLRDPASLRDTIARRCSLRGWSAWVDPLTEWMLDFLSRRFTLAPVRGMAPAGICLSELSGARAELEFWLPVRHLPLGVLDAEVRAASMDGRDRPALMPSQLNGMLKGFIDLVFEHEGRYYVADYKSNRLGADDSAYTAQAMADAVLKSRYELQYVLYLLALHRLLASRLPDYDYDRHIGGAVYFFLRGTRSPGQGLHVEKPPRQLIESLDRMFAGGAPSAEGRLTAGSAAP